MPERTPRTLTRDANVGDRVEIVDLATKRVVGYVEFGRRSYTADAAAGFKVVHMPRAKKGCKTLRGGIG